MNCKCNTVSERLKKTFKRRQIVGGRKIKICVKKRLALVLRPQFLEPDSQYPSPFKH